MKVEVSMSLMTSTNEIYQKCVIMQKIHMSSQFDSTSLLVL